MIHRPICGYAIEQSCVSAWECVCLSHPGREALTSTAHGIRDYDQAAGAEFDVELFWSRTVPGSHLHS